MKNSTKATLLSFLLIFLYVFLLLDCSSILSIDFPVTVTVPVTNTIPELEPESNSLQFYSVVENDDEIKPQPKRSYLAFGGKILFYTVSGVAIFGGVYVIMDVIVT